MATMYVLWDRANKQFVGGPQPALFPSSGAATTHTARIDKHVAKSEIGKTYDAVSVTVA